MQLKLHGDFPVEAITIPPLNVIAYHSAPRDHHHWIVSQVMKGNVAYPITTGLSKQDAKTLAAAIADVTCTGINETKWWQCYQTLEHLQVAIADLVVEIMSSGVSDEVKQRFNNTGEIVKVMNTTVLLWNTDSVNLSPFNANTGLYDKPKPILSRWVFSIEDNLQRQGLVLRTIPEVWVQQELEK